MINKSIPRRYSNEGKSRNTKLTTFNKLRELSIKYLLNYDDLDPDSKVQNYEQWKHELRTELYDGKILNSGISKFTDWLMPLLLIDYEEYVFFQSKLSEIDQSLKNKDYELSVSIITKLLNTIDKEYLSELIKNNKL